MITKRNGDLLESKCDIICHQVNLHGIMGGGLALQIAHKFPQCKEEYEKFTPCCCGGSVYFYEHKAGVIANCYSQELNFDTNYDWLKICFEAVLKFAKKNNLRTIGVPHGYGCGIANGDWEQVGAVLKNLFADDKDIELQIWRLYD